MLAVFLTAELVVLRTVLRVDDLHAATDFTFDNRPARDDVVELDAVVLAPDIAEPVPDIAAQNERIVGRVAIRVFVGDEAKEGNGREYCRLTESRLLARF